MSLDLTTDDAVPMDAASSTVRDHFAEPVSHGAGAVFNLSDLEDPDAPAGERGTLYDAAMDTWRETAGDPENEPGIPEWEFEPDWLDDGRDYCLILTSSRWKAGEGEGDDYRAYYKYDLTVREVVETAQGVDFRVPPQSLNVRIIPQFPGMVYPNGNPLELPYGAGTHCKVQTTFVESFEEIERRAHQAVCAAFGDGAMAFDDQPDDSRRIWKAETHHRVHRDRKHALVDTIEQSEQLVDYGGDAESTARKQRDRHGYVEAAVSTDRWDLLGFDRRDFDTEVKVYQVGDAHDRPDSDWMAHPKIEASFDGSNADAKPHADAWDAIMDHLRTVTNTHCHWGAVERSDLVSDPHYPGPAADDYAYDRPEGRRELLRQRYDDMATEVYRQALRGYSRSPYDVLAVIAEHAGATYDTLEEETGLSRRSVRRHVRKLCEVGLLVKVSKNPVVAAYASRELLDRAREALDQAYPGDDARDRSERAEERRQRREERSETPLNKDGDSQNEGDSSDQDGESGGSDSDPPPGESESDDEPAPDDGQDGSPTDAEPEPIGFRALSELTASLADVVLEYEHDMIADDDIRVRVDALPNYLR